LWVSTAWSQQTIRGKITDQLSGETLIGATVLIQGTTTGTTANVDGSFELKTDLQPPVVLEISFLGYQKQTITVTDFSKSVNVKMETDNVMLDAVEVVDIRITDRQKQAPLTVETMNVDQIKTSPSGDFYQSLGNMKGVDMTSASLGFKVINTRGFNSTSPVRSLQLIDGVDNQSPGLNFSLGNFLGASDLDLMKVDIIAGASSAYYGPGAFNGVINMTTKDPFLFPGLSAKVKTGERDMVEAAVRWAQVLKNKEGKEKFGYKFNVYYLTATDWEAENFDAVDDTQDPATNPGGYDAVNNYGDEATSATNNDFTTDFDKLQSPGLGRIYPTGYNEVDLADYDTRNLKLNGAFHYKIKDDVQAIFSTSYSQGTTIYQGENRFSLKNIQFYQNRLELKKDNKWFIRAYATHEDAGDSYDIVTTALRLQEDVISEGNWNSDYRTYWNLNYGRRVRELPGYPNRSDFDSLNSWANAFDSWIIQHQDSLVQWHNETREAVDSDPNQGDPRYEPGTARFDSAFDAITSRKFNENGSRFFDRSALYHVQGEYKFTPKWAEITVGGNMRWYLPNTEGTIFADTMEYTRLVTDTGVILTDSNFRTITNFQYGIFVGAKKDIWEDKLTINATLRMDKNENFDYLFSPAISLVYHPNENHTYRVTFTSAIRNPTLADQYLYYDVGRAILLGNLDGFDSLIVTSSLDDYLQTFNPDTLEYFNVDPIQPEEVRTIELGYRGIWFDKVYVDAAAYYSWYENFIGFEVGVDSEFNNFGFPFDVQAYRLAANARSTVTTQGVSLGASYYFARNYTFLGNVSYNELTTGDNDPIIPAFNTPRFKYNLGITGKDLKVKWLKSPRFGFGVNYKWVEGFRFEGSPQFTGDIDSYGLVDAQVNMEIQKIHTTFQLGASNVLDNRVYQVYGGPLVGRLAYISVLFDLKTN